MKVFEFIRDGASYTIKAPSPSKARQFLKEAHGVDIPNCIEVPESKWDEKTIEVYVDNDRDNEKFYISLRESMSTADVEPLATNDWSLIDF